MPSKAAGGFHSHPGGDGAGQDGLLVFHILLLEQIHAGYGYHPHRDIFLLQGVGGFHDALHLRTGGHQDHIRQAGGRIPEDIGAPFHIPAGFRVLGQVLPGQSHHRRQAVTQGGDVAGRGFLGVRGAENQGVRGGPQGG